MFHCTSKKKWWVWEVRTAGNGPDGSTTVAVIVHHHSIVIALHHATAALSKACIPMHAVVDSDTATVYMLLGAYTCMVHTHAALVQHMWWINCYILKYPPAQILQQDQLDSCIQPTPVDRAGKLLQGAAAAEVIVLMLLGHEAQGTCTTKVFEVCLLATTQVFVHCPVQQHGEQIEVLLEVFSTNPQKDLPVTQSSQTAARHFSVQHAESWHWCQ